MRYMCLISGDEAAEAALPKEQLEKVFGGYMAYSQEIREKGAFQAGDPLQPTSTATTIRIRDGETIVTDGPFAESKEQLGGYYILECKDLDEAIAWATNVPGTKWGSVEVRPIMEM